MEYLSVSQVTELLQEEYFPENVVQLLADKAVDGKALMMLETDEDMNEVGLRKLGDRLKIKKLISHYEGATNTTKLPPADHEKEVVELILTVPSSSRPSESIFTVTFNVIVSGHCWGWDSTTSELSIALNPPELGGIENFILLKPLPLLRCTENELFVYKFSLKMPYDIVENYTCIYYKYAVKSFRTREAEHIWYMSSKKPVYRCLEIPNSEKTPGGMWEQWDTIVYPPKKAVTLLKTKIASEGYIKMISELITDDPENQEQAHELCLLAYLQHHQDRLMLCDVSSSAAGVSQIVHTIQRIFGQLKTKNVGFLSRTIFGDRIYFTKKECSTSYKISAVMGQWVMDIVHNLQTKIQQCRVDGRHVDNAFLVSAITVLCIADKTLGCNWLSSQNCVQMSNLLRESYRPDQEQRTCSALYVLEQHLPTLEFRKTVAMPALKKLALKILKYSDRSWKWLETVPLYYFLDDRSVPFEGVSIDKPIQWCFWPELKNLRWEQIESSYYSSIDVVVFVEDLMELDYVFAQVVLYMCPHDELSLVLQRVDPILATSFYIWYVKNNRRGSWFFYKHFSKVKNPETLHQHLSAVYMAHEKASNDEWRIKSTFFANHAHQLMTAILETLTGVSESHCEILYHITRYVLSIISLKVSKEHGNRYKINLEDLDECDRPSRIVETIRQWLLNNVGYVRFDDMKIKKFDEEVHVWKVLCRDSICPYEIIKKHWSEAIHSLVKGAKKMVEDEAEFLLHSSEMLDTPERVKQTLIRLYVALDDTSMSPNLPEYELSQRIGNLSGRLRMLSSGDVSELLSKILIQHFEKKQNQVKGKDKLLSQRPTIDELTSWKMWPIMMKFTCDEQSALFYNMTEDAKEICMSAHNVLQVACIRIVAGDITMQEAKFFCKEKEKFQLLCTKAAIKDFKLEKWMDHLEAAVAWFERIQIFHNLLNLGVKGYRALQKELQESSVKSMADLCLNWSICTASADLKFTCCPTIKPCTQAILTPFYHLAVNSELFCHVWKSKLCAALMSHCGDSQEDIVKFVWGHTVEECWIFLNELKSRRISLGEVKELLCEQDLQQSCRALMSFLPPLDTIGISLDDEDSVEWIDTVCEQVKCYFLSLKCIDCAQAVFRLQDKLLEGDFTRMHILGDKESSILTKLSLLEFAYLFQDDIKLLHRITDASKVDFLKSLGNNWKLVEWIKEFKGVKDFQDFVDLALDTIDATDMTVTMLTVLRIVGSIIGQFLFNLPNPCGLNELVTACNDFQLESDHRLLQDCEKNLNHFKSIKDKLMCLAENAEEESLKDDSAVRPLLQENTPRKLEDDNTEVSEICQIRLALQLKYTKLEEAVEKLSAENMSLQEENRELKCILQALQHEVDTLNGTLNREQAEHRDQTAVMNQENERLETTIVEQRQELNQMMSELHTLQQECNKLKQSLDQATIVTHDHERRIAELNDELLQANTETERFKDHYHNEKSERERVEEELQTSAEIRTMLESQLETRNSELDAKYAELRELNKHLTTQMKSDLRKLQIDDVQGLNIAEKKGAGSYGAVYEVKVNGVPCIAKRLHDILVGRGKSESVGDEQMKGAVKQFNQECVLLSRLRHPNIVQFMGVYSGDHEADVSLIMEYMHMDLEHCINTYPDIPLPYKTSILRDVTYGMAYLHFKSTIHRDLNTGNILLTQSLQAKISDVGVSKFFDRTLARTRTKCPGALNFMPPEALTKSPKYGDKLDVFSFGHLTLCLLHQESPDLNDSGITAEDTELNQRQVGKRREAIEKMGSRHPLHSIVVQCLSDIPEQRPTSRELVTRMERICKDHPIPHKNLLEVVAVNQ